MLAECDRVQLSLVVERQCQAAIAIAGNPNLCRVRSAQGRTIF
jgi:hypothetical protein